MQNHERRYILDDLTARATKVLVRALPAKPQMPVKLKTKRVLQDARDWLYPLVTSG